jgi:hypothetical protein
MSDDPTRQVPPTQPTIETVLERINVLDEKLSGEIQTRINALDEKLSGQMKEVKAELRQINRTFEVVAKELLEMKARTLEAEARLDELERKAS